MIVIATIEDEALRGAAGEGCNSVKDALARYGREPPVRNRKLRCHVVVVVQEVLIVVAHGSLASQIGVGTPAYPRTGATFRIALGRVHESIHVDRARSEEVVTVHITVTGQPIRAVVVNTRAAELE